MPFGVTQSKTGVNIRFARAEGVSADNSAASTDKTSINIDKMSREAQILALVSEKGEVSNSDIASLVGLGSVRTREILRKMVSDGLLVKVGDRKSTRYRLANQ